LWVGLKERGEIHVFSLKGNRHEWRLVINLSCDAITSLELVDKQVRQVAG